MMPKQHCTWGDPLSAVGGPSQGHSLLSESAATAGKITL